MVFVVKIDILGDCFVVWREIWIEKIDFWYFLVSFIGWNVERD